LFALRKNGYNEARRQKHEKNHLNLSSKKHSLKKTNQSLSSLRDIPTTMRPVLLVKNNMSNYRVKLISPKKTSERNQLARHDSFLNDSQLAFKAHIQ